ncbi:MAG: PhoH family protein [Candidatus Sericytochromatia bacterium]|nr:PhoH family protein [Candidatus Sericytochromatia bacterium]
MSTREYDKTYIIDTSIILDDVYSIFPLSEGGKNRVVIPETTLDEIDGKKKGFEDINFQAREFNRLLDESVTLEEYDMDFEGDKLSIVVIMIHDSIFELISKKHYRVNEQKEQLNILNDRKILEIASAFPGSTVVSNDIAMRIRAISMKLNSEPLKRNRSDDVENLEFIEVIHISSEQKEKIQYSKDVDYDKKFSIFTNVEFICDDTGQHILAFYKQDGFHIIDEKEIRKLTVRPRNKEQIFFLNMLIDKDVPIVVCAGVTGSGKNLLSLQGALKFSQLNSNKMLSGIKYCRNTITAGDSEAQLGFLKGDESSKLGVFTYPLYDAIETYIHIDQEEALNSKKPIPIQSSSKEFAEENGIEVININQMRGSNLSGFLILDEWQNSSPSVNKLMLTRVVEGSKVVIIGDIHQIDHHHLSKYNNALAIMLKHAKTSDLVGGITMSKVIRGRIAAFADANL